MTRSAAPPGTPPWTAVADDAVPLGGAWLRAELAAAGLDRLVIGLSGGIDSAVTALWAARAIGAERLVLAAMPYGLVAPALFAPSAPDSLADARRVVEETPAVDSRVLDIAPVVDAVAAGTGLAAALDQAPDDPDLRRDLGNVKARVRAVHLRYLANRLSGLVLGTENRTEHLLGHFTVGGDEESDLELLSPYLKSQVRTLASRLGVPAAIVAKAPSADLFAGQTDEGELGYSYADADAVLFATGGDAARRPEALALGVPAAVVDRVLARVARTAFKRRPKPTFPGALAGAP